LCTSFRPETTYVKSVERDHRHYCEAMAGAKVLAGGPSFIERGSSDGN
jgi:hypothetical protein